MDIKLSTEKAMMLYEQLIQNGGLPTELVDETKEGYKQLLELPHEKALILFNHLIDNTAFKPYDLDEKGKEMWERLLGWRNTKYMYMGLWKHYLYGVFEDYATAINKGSY